MEEFFPLYLLITRPAIFAEYANRRNERKIWIRKLFQERERGIGAAANLIPTLFNEDEQLFFNYTRMSKDLFMELYRSVGPRLAKRKTSFRNPIPPETRLAICLRYLATGQSYQELSYNYRVSKAAVHNIVNETCRVIVSILKPKYLNLPKNHDEWRNIEAGFDVRWNFPHCVGAIDGKHIRIQAPPNSGSSYINYKGYHSIVLMATCDANYCFSFVDIGQYGRISDGGVFGDTYLAEKLRNSPNFLPPDTNLINSNLTSPFVFVGDEAFPLQRHLLRPFPGKYLEKEKRIFNYRLSRARRCIENAFGILVARWRVLSTTMGLLPDNAAWVTMACCCLHNFLMKSEIRNANRTYCPISFSDRPDGNGAIDEGVARSQNLLHSLSPIMDTNSPNDLREVFTSYFNNEGAVPWQDNV